MTESEQFLAAVVVPTYNHGKTLIGVLERAEKLGVPIVVVDDGSKDETGRVLAEWAAGARAVRVVVKTHEVNRGKAAAMRTGFEAAREIGCTHAATLDSDGQLSPEDIPKLLAAARASPFALVLGIRSDSIENCPPKSLVGRRISNLLILLESGVRVRDSQCGLRVYPLGLMREVRCAAGRYGFETEIITRAGWAGCGVVEVPVSCIYPPGALRVSHFKPGMDTVRSIGMHARLLARALLPLPHVKWPALSGAAAEKQAWWRRALRWLNPLRSWRELREQSLTRMELATGLALGVFIGTTPLFGLHTAICVYVAWRLHLKPVPLVLGSQISTPPLGVGIAFACIEVGRVIRTGEWPRQEPIASPFREDSGRSIEVALTWVMDWAIGTVPVGGTLAAGAFALTAIGFGILSRRKK